MIYFGSTVTIPLWLQTEQNYTAYWAGIAVAPIGIVPFFFLSTTVGKNMHRFDLRVVASLSFVFLSFGFFYQANFTSDVDLRTVMISRFLQGFGIAIFFLPLVQLSLANFEEKYASASGVYHFVRILVGSGFATSLSIEIWTRLEIFHHAGVFPSGPPSIGLPQRISTRRWKVRAQYLRPM